MAGANTGDAVRSLVWATLVGGVLAGVLFGWATHRWDTPRPWAIVWAGLGFAVFCVAFLEGGRRPQPLTVRLLFLFPLVIIVLDVPSTTSRMLNVSL